MSQGALGKGLSALIPDSIKESFNENRPQGAEPPAGPEENVVIAEFKQEVLELDINTIVPNSSQPRVHFREEQLQSLSDSIKQYGVLQPITVIFRDDGTFELIAGERRLRASKLAGLTKIPAIVRDAEAIEKLELALIENIQRENLNPIEEGRAYRKLMDDFGLTQEDISKRVKKGRSSIANYLRYLRLPQEIQDGLTEGKINEGHAKIIAALDNEEAQLALYRKSVRDNLTVRNIESIARDIQVQAHKRKIKGEASPWINQKEKFLSDRLNLKVQIKPGKKGGGRVIIDYFTPDDLERMAQQLENLSA